MIIDCPLCSSEITNTIVDWNMLLFDCAGCKNYHGRYHKNGLFCDCTLHLSHGFYIYFEGDKCILYGKKGNECSDKEVKIENLEEAFAWGEKNQTVEFLNDY